MKETVIDVLVFLFDNYLSIETDDLNDEMSLTCELEEAGFPEGEIHKAFDWLGNLAELYQTQHFIMPQHPDSIRLLTKDEYAKLDVECQGFLVNLQRTGLLDTVTREIILESAMGLGVERLALSAFKRIIGLVLLNSPRQDELPLWAEDLIFDDELVLH